MRFHLLIALMLCSTLSFAQGTGEVIITEIHNRPQKPTQEQVDAALLADPNNSTNDLDPDEGQVEWFEVYNTTSAPVVMDGWIISDGSNGSSSTISSFTIGPNAYAVFAGYNIPDAHGGVVFDYFYDYEKPSFNNESSYSDDTDSACPDGVILEKADGTLVDQVLYDYGYGNYIGNADASSSCSGNAAPIGIPPQDSPSRTSFMLACDPAVMNCIDNDLAANWSFSTNVYDDNSAEDYGDQLGTPGQPNDAACMVMVDNDMDTYFSDVDCDDNNADVNPGATEIPYNGIDDDCNETTLDDDLDEDGFVLADDCDDTNPEVNPGQTEIAYNGIDDDCDDSTLDDDLDEDGFVLADDCNESDPNINPGEEEIVNNGIDDDCNSLTLDSGSEEQIIARGRGALEAQYGSASGNETYTWFDNDGNEVASFIGNSYFSPSAVGCYSALVTDPDVPGMNFFFDEFCITTLDGCCELDED